MPFLRRKRNQIVPYDPAAAPAAAAGGGASSERSPAQLAAFNSISPAVVHIRASAPVVIISQSQGAAPVVVASQQQRASPQQGRCEVPCAYRIAGVVAVLIGIIIAVSSTMYVEMRDRGPILPALKTASAYQIYDTDPASAAAGGRTTVALTASDGTSASVTTARAAFVAPTSCALPCQWTLRLDNFTAGSIGVLQVRFTADETANPVMVVDVNATALPAGQSARYSGRRLQVGAGAVAITLR